MKELKKITCFCLAAMLLFSVFFSSNYVTAKAETKKLTAKFVADYIKKNTKKFVKAYNETVSKSSEKLKATSVAKQIPVKIVDDNTKGIYVDFNKDNGYIVIDAKGIIIDFEVEGDLSYINRKKLVYYSLTEGFVYFDSKKNMISYKKGVATEEKWKEALKKNKIYDGTDSSRIIIDPDKYVADRYGSKYTLIAEKSLPKKYPYEKQFDNTVYYTIKDDLLYSESNCTLNSVYTSLSYLKTTKKKYKAFPSVNKKIKFDAKKDSFYKKFKKDSNYDIQTPKKLPKLYYTIRQYAITKGYYHIKSGFLTTEGTWPFDITKLIKGVGSKYDIEMKPKQILIYTFTNQVKKEIDAGYPTLFNMTMHSVYGAHSIVVTGYREYVRKTKFLFFDIKEKVQIMKISDNWNKDAVYFDYDEYNGLGSFIKIR